MRTPRDGGMRVGVVGGGLAVRRGWSDRLRLAAVMLTLLALLATPLGAVGATEADAAPAPDADPGAEHAQADDVRGSGASKDLWRETSAEPPAEVDGRQSDIRPKRAGRYTLDNAGMRAALAQAPMGAESAAPGAEGLEVWLPHPDGHFASFTVEEAPIMEPALAAAHPHIRTYRGRGIDQPTATVRLTLTQMGFQASVRATDGTWYIDPGHQHDDSVYLTYYTRDVTHNPHGPLWRPRR